MSQPSPVHVLSGAPAAARVVMLIHGGIGLAGTLWLMDFALADFSVYDGWVTMGTLWIYTLVTSAALLALGLAVTTRRRWVRFAALAVEGATAGVWIAQTVASGDTGGMYDIAFALAVLVLLALPQSAAWFDR